MSDGKPQELLELEAKARDIGRLLKRTMPKGVGFTLLLFDFGHDGWMTYLSSADRQDMIKAMREFIFKLESGAEDFPQQPTG